MAVAFDPLPISHGISEVSRNASQANGKVGVGGLGALKGETYPMACWMVVLQGSGVGPRGGY